MLVYCFYLLLLGGVVTPFSIANKQHGLHTIGGGKMISWEPRTMISSEDYPCVKEGLYSHPTNCSRFYRCVDFTRESRIFSRYLFECPEGMVFAETIQACVPGVCPEQAAKLPDPSTGATDTSGSGGIAPVGTSGSGGISPVGTSGGSLGETISGGEVAGSEAEITTEPAIVVEETSTSSTTATTPMIMPLVAASVGGSESSTGTVEKEITGLPPVIDQDKNVVSPDKLPGVKEPCKTKYVQHEKFCNLFHLCEDPNSIFSCYDGTAFSTERQMCRLSQFEEALCEGKEIFVPSAEFFRSAFNWKEVGVVPLDGNPVYNSNPYFFMNIGDGFGENVPTPSVEPVKLTESSKPFQTRFPSESSRPRPQIAPDTKDRKKTRFSSLLGSITSLLTGNRKLPSTKPSASTTTNRKTIVPKVTRKEKISQNEKPKQKDTSAFDYSPFLSSFSDMSSFGDLFNSADPSKTSISTSPFLQQSIPYAFSGSIPSSAFSPIKEIRQSQSPFLSQGMQMGYSPSQGSIIYSPYAGYSPYAFGSPDISSIFRTQASSPSNVFSQAQSPSLMSLFSSPTQSSSPMSLFSSAQSSSPMSLFSQAQSSSPMSLFGQAQSSNPFSSAGSFFPYSPSFGSSLGLIASPYGFLYDPTRNSLIPVAIPPSYMNSLYASLLGSNPYSSLFQLSDKEAEELLSSALMSETKPAQSFENKKKASTTKKSSKANFPQKYPFLYNFQDASPFSSLGAAFEARNEDGETYQIVPLSEREVDTLAKRGLLERATKVTKPFTYDDLENLNEGEVILTSFAKKK